MDLISSEIQRFIFLIISIIVLTSSPGKSGPLPCPLPPELAKKLHVDPGAIESASTDFGNIVHNKPAAVLYPSSIQDISSLIKASFTCSTPFGISARGNGHSTHGQDMANNGVVVDMKGLREQNKGDGIVISTNPLVADVGGEQLWIDVLNATIKKGVAPVSWTDYLHLTVGGTLSNAGISGQSFRFGPQISNVYEMDVVTGKGEVVTCSFKKNSDLFYGVLGGLGQLGIIKRARIGLGPAPRRVLWAQALYSNFSAFTADQEKFIANNRWKPGDRRVIYLEGGLLLDNGTPNTWSTYFFPPADLPLIQSLVKKHGIIYSLEMARSYKGSTVEKEMNQFFQGLISVPEYIYQKQVSYVDFLTRVQITVLKNESHPWLNLFIPKSRISDFNSGVFRDIVLKRNITVGPVLFYPLFRDAWNAKMSAVIPDEDIFYSLGLLYTSGVNDWNVYEDQTKAIIDFCDKAGIKIKHYLANHATKEEWIKHFGSKWIDFERRKALFDPKMILSPGQGIFNK